MSGKHGKSWARWVRERLPHGHSHGHDHGGETDDAFRSSAEGIRTLKISLAVLAVTGAFQLVVALVSGSVALLADTIHNFGDALTALPLWLAFALSRRAANRSYTYGYGRAEDLAGVAIVGIIFFSACVAGYESVLKLITGSEVGSVGWVAVAAAAGFAGNEFVAQLRVRTGRRIGSAALIADGQHARVDGFTSLAVLAGAGGVALGLPILDPLVGLGITVAILFIVKDSARSMWRRMMDAAEPEIVDSIERSAAKTTGVEAVESVRARWVGHRVHSELHIRVDGNLSVAEGREISDRVVESAREANPRLERLSVEVSPAPG